MKSKTWRITEERMSTLTALAKAGDDRQAWAVLAEILAQHAAQTRAQADQATAALRDLRAFFTHDQAPSGPQDQADAS